MVFSDNVSTWWAKKKFKLRKQIARLKNRAFVVIANAFRSIWSLRGATGLVLIILVIDAVDLFITIRGKLVILPFEVHAEQTLPSDFGSAFAASLADRLNDYRTIFPDRARREIPISHDENSFNIIDSFLANVPLVSIPHLSPLNKGSTALESIKIGPVDIPIRRILFENLAFFHRDTLHGTIEAIGDRITARLFLGSDERMVISVPKEQGYRKLIDRISVELLEHKKWISPIPMKPAALELFAKGLASYHNYTKFGELSFLSAARKYYKDALEADRNADFVRLHLAATEYKDDALLGSAVSDFSILRGSAQFARQARIGHAASELRLMEQSGGCNRTYQYLQSTIREIESWTDIRFEEAVVRAGTYLAATTYMLPNSGCSEILSKFFHNMTFEDLADKAKRNYLNALELLSQDNHFSPVQKQHYRLAIELQQKYLLDNLTDFAILAKKDVEAERFAKSALQAGLTLAAKKDKLPDAQRRFFAPYFSGSNAESHLRLAAIIKSQTQDQDRLATKAIDLLRKTVSEGDEKAARWAMLRLADLELSRNHTHEGLEWIMAYFNRESGPTISILNLVDDRAFAAGILIERPQLRCKAITLFHKADVTDSIFGRLLTADAYRRAGDLKMAARPLVDIERASVYATEWLGPLLPSKVELVRAKLDAVTDNTKRAVETLGTIMKNLPNYRDSPMLLMDAYELASILQDQQAMTRLADTASGLPFSPDLFGADQTSTQGCAKDPG